MSETDPLRLHQADQDRTDFDFAAIESDLKFIVDRIAGTADAQGLGEDTVDLDFLGCRSTSYGQKLVTLSLTLIREGAVSGRRQYADVQIVRGGTRSGCRQCPERSRIPAAAI
jgi:hypothetical protein